VRIVWFSWKDRWHPEAGGAETVSGEIMDRLARDGHSVFLITARYPLSSATETKNGVTIIRTGGRYGVYLKARGAYRKHIGSRCDLIIDEMNTIPFFASTYAVATKKLLLSYQLARHVWFYQMVFPLSVIGYLLEPFMLRILGWCYPHTVTESISSKKDMARHGLKNINVFRVGMSLAPVKTLPRKVAPTTILSLGAVRPMKRTLHIVKAFEVARDQNPSLSLVIAGDTTSSYGYRVIKYVSHSRHKSAIDIRGRVSAKEKLHLMRRAAVILVTSVKEGWGLIVTEANSQGTPAIVYDVDGLRDSVQDGKTGLICPKGDYEAMGRSILILLGDPVKYEALRTTAWSWSKEFTFENSYRDFAKIAGIASPSTD